MGKGLKIRENEESIVENSNELSRDTRAIRESFYPQLD